jgi:hypothetical protein
VLLRLSSRRGKDFPARRLKSRQLRPKKAAYEVGLRRLEESSASSTRAGGFCNIRRGFNRQALVRIHAGKELKNKTSQAEHL